MSGAKFGSSVVGQIASAEFDIATLEIKREGFSRALRKSLNRMDDLIASSFESNYRESGSRPACKSGCDYCCRTCNVQASTEEILLIVAYLQKKCSLEKQEKYKRRIRSNAEAVMSMSNPGAPRDLPCAFLENGSCSIYSVRPSKCRGHHSLDVDKCRQLLPDSAFMPDEVPRVSEVVDVNKGHPVGFLSAMVELNYDANVYELNTALDEAIVDRECFKRFKKGKVAFKKAIRVKHKENPKGNFFGR